MYADNHILFPPQAVARLARVRGAVWRDLVDQVASRPQDHPESLAFSLMMIRLDGCLNCEMDSYRAMRGCTACALQTLNRFKGSDDDLLLRFRKALEDVGAYLASHSLPDSDETLIPARAA